MSSLPSILRAFESVCEHRDVVPTYFVRSKGVFIITGVGATNGGAVIVDHTGQIVRACPTKRAALASIGCN